MDRFFSKRNVIILSIVFVIFMMGIIFIVKFLPGIKADSAINPSYVYNLDFENSATTRGVNNAFNTSVLAIKNDSDALSGSYVLNVNDKSRSQTRSVSATCNDAPLQALNGIMPGGTYSISIPMKGEIKGSHVSYKVFWSQKSSSSSWFRERSTVTQKSYERKIYNTELDKNNWTIINSRFTLPASAIAGSVNFSILSECSSSMFVGQIDSPLLAINKSETYKTKVDDGTVVLVNPSITKQGSVNLVSLYDSVKIPLEVSIKKPIYSLSITGSGVIKSTDSFNRITISGSDDKEYQIFEANGVINSKGKFDYKNVSEETTVFSEVIPKKLSIYSKDCDWEISSVRLITQKDNLDSTTKAILNKSNDFNAAVLVINTDNKSKIDQQRIQKTSEWAKTRGLTDLKLGETSISRSLYNKKKELFADGVVPPLNGFEYYKGGTYEDPTDIPNDDALDSREDASVTSLNPLVENVDAAVTVPDSFDWRTWQTGGNSNGGVSAVDLSGQGSAKSCWAWAATSVIEANIKIKYGLKSDVNLSEQWAMCQNTFGWTGPGYPSMVFGKIVPSKTGVMPSLLELRYSESMKDCSPVWSTRQHYGWKIEKYNSLGTSGWASHAATIKRNLVEKGPLTFGIVSDLHIMTLVGYTKNSKGHTIWTLKNSWGSDWGDNGYAYRRVNIYNRMGLYTITNPYPTDPYFDKDNKPICTSDLKDCVQRSALPSSKKTLCPRQGCNYYENEVVETPKAQVDFLPDYVK